LIVAAWSLGMALAKRRKSHGGTMKIETKYDVGQVVYISDYYDHKARVISVKITGPNRTVSYDIEYWMPDGIKSSTLYEYEISDVKSDRNSSAKISLTDTK